MVLVAEGGNLLLVNNGPVIKLDDISKTYRMGDVQVNALRGVTYSINKGEMLAIMGPSGSGKSTMMNILGCLDKPSSGTYLLDGIDVTKLSDGSLAEVRNQKIGFVFQSFNLLRRASALDNVALPLLYGDNKNSKARAMEQLSRVGLAKRAHHKPNQLSGGEQQRVAIARSLINTPAIVLADEPTGNLDTRASNEIMNLFQELHSQGITIVVVTHERDVAEFCEKIVFFRDGQMHSEEVIRHRRRVQVGALTATEP